MENQLFLKFPIMGKGNPLKKAVLLCEKIKSEFGIEANIGNADPGDFDMPPEPYSLLFDNEIIWSGKKLDNEAIFTALEKHLSL